MANSAVDRAGDVAAFEALLRTGKDRTKMGRFRELFDLVERATAAGVKQPAILRTLAERGLILSSQTLSSYIARVRSERAYTLAARPTALASLSASASPAPSAPLPSNTPSELTAPARRNLDEVLKSKPDVFALEQEFHTQQRDAKRAASRPDRSTKSRPET